MRIPRWTVYPALAILLAFLVPAFPKPADPKPSASTTASDAKRATRFRKMVMLGIDGLDGDILRETIAKYPDGTKNWTAFIAQGGLRELTTSTPPQSPVAWSNFITGMDPGGHGIYDFIHRDLTTRGPIPSTVRSEPSEPTHLFGDWQFPAGGESESNRTGKAFWQILAEHGIPADIWRMPANFPVEPAKGLSFSGMMTPAIDSAYGTYSFYSSDPPAKSVVGESKIIAVREFDGRIDTYVEGRENDFKRAHVEEDGAVRTVDTHLRVPLKIYLDRTAKAAALELAEQALVLQVGQWSDFLHVTFEPLPGGIASYSGILRFYLRSIDPVFEMYASPINIDPTAPVAPVSEPANASAELAKAIGLYYTQGMPEDVNALKHGVLSDAEFMQQSDLVHAESLRMLDYAFERWYEDDEGGLLFFYFSGIDLCGHMMWRHADEKHPHHDPAFAATDSSKWSHRPGSTWKDVIHDLYLRMDPVVGRVRELAGEDALLIVMSDHGFESYRRKFSLNTWLLEQGYLVLKPGLEKELAPSAPGFAPVHFNAVDWSKTRAYGMGFNGLYLNLAGRERDDPKTSESEAGIVRSGPEADALLAEIKTKLESLRDTDGTQVVVRADLARDVFHGTRTAEAPDIIVGYNAGYGNSDEASTGRITHAILEDNLGGTFNGSHLMAPDVVPGVLMTNGAVAHDKHGLEDLTVEILKQYGIAPVEGMRGSPVLR